MGEIAFMIDKYGKVKRNCIKKMAYVYAAINNKYLNA